MDKLSTEKIWQEFSKQLKNFIQKRVGDSNDVEDIMQDIFVKIHKNVDDLEKKKNPRAWLYTVARNTITDFYRTKKPCCGASEEILDNIPETTKEDDPNVMVLSKCLKGVIDDLPEKYREAILFTEFGGHSQKELAEKKNISVSCAKSRVQRAKKQMKDMMDQSCKLEYDSSGKLVPHDPKKIKCKYCC